MAKRLILCILTLLFTGTAIGAGAFWAWHPSEVVDRLLAQPGILAVLRQQTHDAVGRKNTTTVSPLVQQAKCFGLY
ncbi:hypothetical protein ACFL6U_25655, partial [Planctomycetota bacterium]